MFLDENALEGKRVGALRALVDTEEADPEITALFDQALAALQDAGAEIVDDFSIRNFDEHVSKNLFCRRFRYDMHLYLASLGDAAPIQDVAEVLVTKDYSPYIEDSLKTLTSKPVDLHPAEFDPPCPDFLEHQERQAFLSDVIESMDGADIDVVVYPSWTNSPAHLDRAIEEYKGDNSQRVAPATGLPAATVPMGYSRGNLPAGLQILGRPYSEGLLIGIAYAYEQATRHRVPPAKFPELVLPAPAPAD